MTDDDIPPGAYGLNITINTEFCGHYSREWHRPENYDRDYFDTDD